VTDRTPTTAAMGPKARALLATISEYDDFYGILLDVLAEARASLDVERLARALQRVIDNGDALALFREDAEAIAREYAREYALEEPTP